MYVHTAMSFLQMQPFRTAYLLFELIMIAVVWTPLWIILALPPGNRALPSWTIKREVMVKLLKRASTVVGRIGFPFKEPDHLALECDPDVQGVWLSATPHLIVGELEGWAALAQVEAIRVPAYWYHKKGSRLPTGTHHKPGERIILALHAGGYATGSAHPSSAVAVSLRGTLDFAPLCVTRCLAVEYRLSKPASHPTPNPFPAALLDAIAGYAYLVNDVGCAPEDIIIQGCSAGGNLALALTRYLVGHHHIEDVFVPEPPGGLILCSPWVDLGPLPKSPSSSVYTNLRSDFLDLTSTYLQSCIKNLIGPLGAFAKITDPYISPVTTSAEGRTTSFAAFPRTFILCGGSEVARDQVQKLRDMMTADMGPDLVRFLEMPGAIHDFLSFKWHEPERSEALHAIGEWIASMPSRVDVV